jgi:carboxyl-terminal processing protease
LITRFHHIFILTVLALGLSFAPPATAQSPVDDDTYAQLELFGEVFERVRGQYVEEVSDKQLIEYAINGMLTSLDPHSAFLNEDDFEQMQVQTKGEFGGLGIEVTMDNGLVKVVSPIDDTPAAAAGLESGDLVIRIDGEEVMGLTLSEAVDKMRGEVGSDITLTVTRPAEENTFDVTITRDIIQITPVRHRVEQDVGYIRITTFNEQVENELKAAIRNIETEAGDNLRGFVIDLRNNPGGLLDQAIFVSDSFLNGGEIVSTRGRQQADTQRFQATEGDLANGLPVVVLINGGSASASEIVAGAIQDHRRGIVLGTPSFGKGSVQTVMGITRQNAIRITTARYYTPSGRSIQAKGIDPDIVVKPAKIEQIDRQYTPPREADLQGALDVQSDDDDETGTNDTDGVTADKPQPVDYQLQRAIDLIRGVSLFKENQELLKTGILDNG